MCALCSVIDFIIGHLHNGRNQNKCAVYVLLLLVVVFFSYVVCELVRECVMLNWSVLRAYEMNYVHGQRFWHVQKSIQSHLFLEFNLAIHMKIAI